MSRRDRLQALTVRSDRFRAEEATYRESFEVIATGTIIGRSKDIL